MVDVIASICPIWMTQHRCTTIMPQMVQQIFKKHQRLWSMPLMVYAQQLGFLHNMWVVASQTIARTHMKFRHWRHHGSLWYPRHGIVELEVQFKSLHSHPTQIYLPLIPTNALLSCANPPSMGLPWVGRFLFPSSNSKRASFLREIHAFRLHCMCNIRNMQTMWTIFGSPNPTGKYFTITMKMVCWDIH